VGYDFIVLRMKRPPPAFPCRPEADLANAMAGFADRPAIVAALVAQTRCRANGTSDDGSPWCWWDTPDGGSLDIHVMNDAINIDTHAHWQYVLEVLRCVKTIHPDAMILDPQKYLLHDDASFARFVEQAYARNREPPALMEEKK
jgi:hypothetical protein